MREPSAPRPPAIWSDTSRRLRVTVRRSSSVSLYFGSKRSAGRRPWSAPGRSTRRPSRSIAPTNRRAGALRQHAGEIGRLAREEHVAGLERRRRGRSHRHLHHLVTEQPLRLDARDRVPADAVGVAPSDGEVDPHLPARLAGQVHVGDATDLHAGEPDRRPLREPSDFGELGVNRVVRLEEPRARAEGVHHAEEGRERHEDEHPHTKLHRDLAPLVIHRLASPSAAARTATFIDSPRPRLRLALPHSSTHLASPARKAWTAPSVVSSTASTGPIVAKDRKS